MHARRQRVLTRIRQFFDRANVARLIVAFVLAFALWAWVTAQTDPEVSRTIPQVPVTAVNVAPGFRVGSDLQPVEVHLQGAQSRIQAMETGTVRALIDLSEIDQPGTYTIPVKVEAPDGIRVRDVIPNELPVEVVAAPSAS